MTDTGKFRRKRVVSAAFLLAIAAFGIGCSHAPSDKQIALHVKARLRSDPELKGNRLTVAVKAGVATLSGQVASVAARYEAFKVAAETAGVKKVDDDMTIEEPSGHTQTLASTPTATANGKPQPHVARRRRNARPRALAKGQSASSVVAERTPPSGTGPKAPNVLPKPAPTVNTFPVQLPVPPPERITIPQGARIDVRMIDSVNSAVNHTGDILHASLAKPIRVGKQLVAPRGSDVYLRLVEVRSAGHFAGKSELRLELYRIVIQGTSYPLVSNDYVDKGPSRAKRTVLSILGGSAIGAAIGAIAGGGKGAAIGAAAGGGGGAVYQGATNGKQVQIAPEAMLKFKLEQPASVALNPAAPLAAPESSHPTLQREIPPGH